jgi:hypothetical protein
VRRRGAGRRWTHSIQDRVHVGDSDKMIMELLTIIIEAAEESEINGEVSNGKTT